MIDLPLGLGSRHVAAASISRDTQAVAVVVCMKVLVVVLVVTAHLSLVKALVAEQVQKVPSK